MSVSESVDRLQQLVKAMITDKVGSSKEFSDWKKGKEKYLEQIFGYQRQPDMPAIYNLVKASFHPELPLVSFNYSSMAHNTLHAFPQGWTSVLRLCRGIVFDLQGNLVALPFPKFFNHGELPETRELPDLPFEVTIKMDGHLGIIFKYDNRFVLTTRGSFTSETSVLGNSMLARHAKKHKWDKHFPSNTTLMVEVIHPETHVHVDYGSKKDFVIIGATDNIRLQDLDYKDLVAKGRELKLPVTEKWEVASLGKLAELMKDRSFTNLEGFVVRFSNGYRVKFKFEAYIGLMVQEKLSYAYLMNRMASGSAKKMLDTLPEEVYPTALQMIGEIMLQFSVPGKPKDKWRALYDLHQNGVSENYFRGVCRKFVKSMVQV